MVEERGRKRVGHGPLCLLATRLTFSFGAGEPPGDDEADDREDPDRAGGIGEEGSEGNRCAIGATGLTIQMSCRLAIHI
jgi:hypothetical protein